MSTRAEAWDEQAPVRRVGRQVRAEPRPRLAQVRARQLQHAAPLEPKIEAGQIWQHKVRGRKVEVLRAPESDVWDVLLRHIDTGHFDTHIAVRNFRIAYEYMGTRYREVSAPPQPEVTAQRPAPDALTDTEDEVLTLAGRVASRFGRLPQLHPSDRDDVVFHVHAIQNIVLARAAYARERR